MKAPTVHLVVVNGLPANALALVERRVELCATKILIAKVGSVPGNSGTIEGGANSKSI